MLVAMRRTKLDKSVFPAASPWSAKEVLDDGFWPN
jgi:hypothetical protein